MAAERAKSIHDPQKGEVLSELCSPGRNFIRAAILPSLLIIVPIAYDEQGPPHHSPTSATTYRTIHEDAKHLRGKV